MFLINPKLVADCKDNIIFLTKKIFLIKKNQLFIFL